MSARESEGTENRMTQDNDSVGPAGPEIQSVRPGDLVLREDTRTIYKVLHESSDFFEMGRQDRLPRPAKTVWELETVANSPTGSHKTRVYSKWLEPLEAPPRLPWWRRRRWQRHLRWLWHYEPSQNDEMYRDLGGAELDKATKALDQTFKERGLEPTLDESLREEGLEP
jgi:hypothetical protein